MGLTTPQKEVIECSARFRVLISGRRFGKTFIAINELARFARYPKKRVWYVAPTFRMAKQIVWSELLDRLDKHKWIKNTNHSDLTVTLKNNSTISLRGADNEQSLRGVGLDFLCMDEFADIKEMAWYEVLRATLSDKNGHALFCGTPRGYGNWSYNLFTKKDEDENWASFQYTTLEGGQVPHAEIEQAKADLDKRTFKQEYEASFVNYAGNIYYNFDRVGNVIRKYERKTNVIHVGMDFNISPMVCVVAEIIHNNVYIFDEIQLFSSNTNEMADEIHNRYHGNHIFIYPDPACKQSRTSAGGKTDLSILKNAGFDIKVRNFHPLIRDRINAVNSKLQNTKGEKSLFIASNCKNVIKSIERQIYKEGTSVPDKTSGYDHFNDALGYMIEFLYPLKREYTPSRPMRFS